MSDQQPDPWATVREEWIEDAGGGRMMQYATDVDDARAEVERRHAEELKAKDEQILRLKALVESMHQPALEAQIAAAGQVAMLNRRAYLEAQEKLESMRAQLAEKDDEHQRHFEIMQQTQNLASSIMDEQRTQIANITSERNAANARLAEVEVERDESEAQVESLRAQLAAVSEV